MDSLTQIVLGAAVGELTLGRKVGNRAMLWGAVAGTIPDLDVMTIHFVDDLRANEWHRAFSHSILFCLLAAPLFARFVKRAEKYFLTFVLLLVFAILYASFNTPGGAESFSLDQAKMYQMIIAGLALITSFLLLKFYKKSDEASAKDWTKLFWWCLFTHPLLDCHTSWGTQLLWPLPYKFAWNNIFVLDPLYTTPFLLCVIVAMFLRRESKRRRQVNILGLYLSSAYMVLSLAVKYHVHREVSSSLDRQSITYKSISTRPTPLNIILWSANVNTAADYKLAYYSIYDTKPEVDFVSIDKQHELLGAYANHDKVQRLIKLAQGEYVIRQKNDTLIFNDLRFGQFGALGNDADFVFAYKLIPAGDDLLVKQITPPRPVGQEGEKMKKALIKRLKGESSQGIPWD